MFSKQSKQASALVGPQFPFPEIVRISAQTLFDFFRPSKRILWIICTSALLPLLIPHGIYAIDSAPSKSEFGPSPSEIFEIPSEYGEVIYRCNQGSPKQLFIIGTSHRDSLTRQNSANTSRVQAEVYKIGEWLIRSEGLELLLPEGFFKTKPEKVVRQADIRSGIEKRYDKAKLLDMNILEKKLRDDSTFVNAEMLLRQNYPLQMEQVEDKICYDAVGKGIQKLVNCENNNMSEYFILKSELDYLHERRTAAILQKVPEIIENEFHQGKIKNRKAFLTIGMYHIRTIINYLNKKKITIYPSIPNSGQNEDDTAVLNLSKENFGVFIILPRTLVNDFEILRISGLDKIVAVSSK